MWLFLGLGLFLISLIALIRGKILALRIGSWKITALLLLASVVLVSGYAEQELDVGHSHVMTLKSSVCCALYYQPGR